MAVMSVTGPIAAAELGATLVHEHIIVGMPGQELDPTQAPDRREIVAMAVDKLQELKAHGVSTIVDPCPIELGRDPELYADVSERSGVNIVFATGFYYEGSGIPLYWRARDRGHDHPHAVRILARAWLHIIWHCWQDGLAYEPGNHRALQRVLAQQNEAA